MHRRKLLRAERLGTVELEAVAWTAIVALLLGAAGGPKTRGLTFVGLVTAPHLPPRDSQLQLHPNATSALLQRKGCTQSSVNNLCPSRSVSLPHGACLPSGAG